MQDEEESVAPAPGDVDRRPSSTSTGGGSVAGGGGGSQSGSATCGGGYSGDCSSNGSTAWSSSDNSTESHSGKRARRGEVTADDGGNKVSRAENGDIGDRQVAVADNDRGITRRRDNSGVDDEEEDRAKKKPGKRGRDEDAQANLGDHDDHDGRAQLINSYLDAKRRGGRGQNQDTGSGSRRHHGHHHRHHHHHLPTSEEKAQSYEMGRKIDEIMNLYNVSLRAAEVDNATAAASRDKLLEINSKKAEAGSMDIEKIGKGEKDRGGDGNVLNDALQVEACAGNSKDLSKAHDMQLSDGHNQHRQEAEQQGFECHASLMEACRPFFREGIIHNLALSMQQQPFVPSTNQANTASRNSNGGSEGSSGFTSFFTTTKSESNHNDSGSGGTLTGSIATDLGVRSSRHNNDTSNDDDAAQADRNTPVKGDKTTSGTNDIETDQSDSSSMIVLARVKRKHKEQQGQQTATSCSSSSENANDSRRMNIPIKVESSKATSKRRVRIDAVAIDRATNRRDSGFQDAFEHPPTARANEEEKVTSQSQLNQHRRLRQQRAGESSSGMSSLTQTLDSSGSDGGQWKKDSGTKSTTGKSNSSNTDSTAQASQSMQGKDPTKPCVVTGSSSGATTANGSSGSGASRSKSPSVSGPGGDVNSDEQKVPGEGNSIADAVNKDPNRGGASSVCAVADRQPNIHQHHYHHRTDQADQNEGGKATPNGAAAASNIAVTSTQQEDVKAQEDAKAVASKEKIMEKKRKRMDKRREYEEEVQRQMRDPSESSSREQYETHIVIEPGRPVTLEEVLSITKVARLLVQALPPFLAVHVNAAFTALCGVQSSAAIGTPVSSIISHPSSTAKESDHSGSDNTNNKDGMSSLSGSVEDGNNSNSNNSNVAIANDADVQMDSQAHVNRNNHIDNESILKIDRLIIARGYGSVHEVEVVFVPHQPHAHAIEGSEVKFIEGKQGPAKSRKNAQSKILCRMSISPVVSAAAQAGSLSSSNELSSVKHYLIQLEAASGPRMLVTKSYTSSSTTDTTLAAGLLGITKSDVHARRSRLERSRNNQSREEESGQQGGGDQQANQSEEDSQDEGSGSAMDPVATCG